MSAAIEAAMLDATTEGISVIPLRENKRPAVPSWKEYIDAPADLLQVQAWAKTCEGFAMLCGGPQRIQVLDFEALFMQPIYFTAFAAQMNKAGLGELFAAWRAGYMVVTPGGGMHIAVHVGGDGTPPGNTKLAMDAEGNTLVETRGHGGYVVAAPSNGRTHPNGGKWLQAYGQFSEIAWATPEEWAAVCSVISKFDAPAAASETPPEALPPRALPGGVSLSRIETTNSWIDGLKLPLMSEVLENFGWTYHHSDAEKDYWTRPGKPVHDGHSATVNRNGRLCCFSENATPVPVSKNNYTESFDVIDVSGCYQLGQLPNLTQRVELLRRYHAIVPADHIRTPVNVTAADGGWLSDDFWEATEYLSAIRQAAWAAQRCPEAFLGAVLSTYSVRIPSSITLEALVGGNESPLNLYVAMVGQTGAGKSGAIGVSRKLCGVTNSESYHYGKTLRSGEGLVTAVIINQGKRKDDVPLTALHRNGVQIVYDEGNTLAAQNERNGSTVVGNFCTAWSGVAGSMVGGVLAGGEVSFPADQVRISLIIGIQFGVGSALFTGSVASQGFPGRMLYFGMDRPGDRSLRRRGAPAVLDLPTYYPSANSPVLLTFPVAVEDEVSAWDDARQREGVHPLDGHKMLVRMRTAGLLALMDRAAQVEPNHWQLAGEIEKHSLATRARVLSAITELSTQSARAAGIYDAVKQNATHDYWVEERAISLAKAVHIEPLAWRKVKDRFSADKRQFLPEVVQYALERNWVQYATGDGPKTLIPGERKPPP